VVILYVLGHNLGKTAGCYLGAKFSGAAPSIRKYSGLGLFAQGGVAIGLSIMASQHLGNIRVTSDLTLGDVIIFGVTATTMIVQLIGPSCVKLSIKLAGEINRNVTEEDIISALTVADVMISDVYTLRLTDNVGLAIERFARSKDLACPVVDSDGKLMGILTLTHLRDIFLERECWSWMLVVDVMQKPVDLVRKQDRLSQALELLDKTGSQQILVVEEG
jgi:CBS domain-containing protein